MRAERIAVVVMLVLSAPMLLLGIDWGLPTRDSDRYLFGERVAWTGKEIVELAGEWKPAAGGAGADVDATVVDRSQALVLNDTDAKRAELVRRWRLYTAQPDELINLRAFSGMWPGRLELDPRLYQYGGVWFYPVAGVLKVCSVLGLCDLRGDVVWYLDRPEAMGRLYLIMRLVTVGWALLGVGAVYALGREMGAKAPVAAMGGVAWGVMPAVVVFGHEAKPHVAGVALLLWAGWAGVRYVRGLAVEAGKEAPHIHAGLSRVVGSWWLSGLMAGLSFGAVVSMLPGVLVPMMAVWVRGERVAKRMVGVVGVFVATYFVTNPYVLKWLVLDVSVLRGQLGNSTAMYGVSSLGGAVSTAFFLLMMLSPSVLVVLMVVGLGRKERWWPVGLKVMGPAALAMLVIFVMLAGGKPGEYARFGLVPASFGVLSVIYLATRFRQQGALLVMVIALHLLLSVPETVAFLRDEPRSPDYRGRLKVVEETRLTMVAEPAPYNTPAVDLWKTELVLLPRNTTERPLMVQPPRADGYWKMSWADRRVEIDRAALDRSAEVGNTSR